MPITLEQAVEQAVDAKRQYMVALARYALAKARARYRQELSARLGKLYVLLDIKEVHEHGKGK